MKTQTSWSVVIKAAFDTSATAQTTPPPSSEHKTTELSIIHHPPTPSPTTYLSTTQPIRIPKGNPAESI